MIVFVCFPKYLNISQTINRVTALHENTSLCHILYPVEPLKPKTHSETVKATLSFAKK